MGLLVIAAGAVGLELGSVWNRLGSQVTVVEMLPQITPFADKQMAGVLQRSLAAQGLELLLGTKVTSAKVLKTKVRVTLENDKGETSERSVETVLVSVGRTDAQLKEEGIPFNTGRFMFRANGRAKSLGQEEGMVKILAHKDTDQILGVHMVGPRVFELIAEAVAVMEFGGSAEDLARTCHAHPTLSEAVKEAAMAVDKRAIHG